MKYRLEYSATGAESGGSGRKEFEAGSDEIAASLVEKICEEINTVINKDISNEFWHFEVNPTRLVRIIRPEISEEVPIPAGLLVK
jgi:hypothetical protein